MRRTKSPGRDLQGPDAAFVLLSTGATEGSDSTAGAALNVTTNGSKPENLSDDTASSLDGEDDTSTPIHTYKSQLVSCVQLALCTLASIIATFLGMLACIITSSRIFSIMLWLTVHSDDRWALRLVSAVLRLAVLVNDTLRSAPQSVQGWCLSLASIASVASVELSLLLSQPIFFTIVGGTFKPGDSVKQAALKLGRSAWLMNSWMGLLALVCGLALSIAERVKFPRPSLMHGYPRAVMSALHRAAWPMCTYFAVARGKSTLIWWASGVDVVPYISYIPILPSFLISRQECSLFWWSVDSTSALLLILAGDLAMSNSLLPPVLGLAGSVAMRCGLWLSGIDPTVGFYLHALAWAVHAGCEILAGSEARRKRAPKVERRRSQFVLTVAAGSIAKSSSSTLRLRVAGWRRPIYLSFDKALCCYLLISLIVAKPSAAWELVMFASEVVHTAYRGGCLLWQGYRVAGV